MRDDIHTTDAGIIVAPVHYAWLCGKCNFDGSCALTGCTPVEPAKVSRPTCAISPMNEGDKAMAAEPSMPSALELSDEWLCGTGAAYDLVSRDTADKYTDFQVPATPINFFTQQMAFIAPTRPCPWILLPLARRRVKPTL